MGIFWNIVKMELRLYRRGMWLWITLASLVIYLTYGYYLFSKDGLGAGEILQASSFIVMAAALLGLISGVVIAKKERDAQLEEVLLALPGDNVRPISKITAWFIVVFLIISISISIILLLHILWESQLLQFWWMTVSYILLYWGMTLFSSGIIGYSLQQLIRSSWSYPILFIIWIAISPYNNIFIPQKVASILNQGEKDPNAPYSSFQGLNISMEVVARHLFLFAIAILLLTLSVYFRPMKLPEKRIARRLQIAILIVFVMCIMIVPVTTHESRYTLDDLYSKYFQDLAYYQNLRYVDINDLTHSQDSRFQVKSYHIQLQHHNTEISYTSKLDIFVPNPKEVNWLVFTLYHDLHVSELYLDTGETDWYREGDLLIVKWDKANSSGKLNIKVRGTTGHRNPVDESSFYLASSFPWYPIPGNKLVAELTPNRHLQYKNLELPQPASFNLEVEKRGKVFSNLEVTGINQFGGEAKGVTLLYGRLLESFIDGKHIVAPADFTENIAQLLPIIQKNITEIGEKLNVDTVQLPKHIFIVPLSTSLNLYPMELTSDQLLLSAEEYSIYYNNPELVFTNHRFLLPAIYWHNQYQIRDGLFPFLGTALYDHLYNSKVNEKSQLQKIVEMKTHSQWEQFEIMQQYAQRLLNLYTQGLETELQDMLNDWYQEAMIGDTQAFELLLSGLEGVGKED